mgnify:CR=1 FL=1
MRKLRPMQNRRVTASHRLIHRSSDKEALYNSSDLLRWSDDLDCWLACDTGILIAILKNADFRVIDYEKETMKIVDGLGVDLLATASVARHLPLGQEGCPHASLRKQMAVDLSRKAAPALLAFDDHVRTEVPRIFAGSGEFDIVAELLAPLAGTLVAALSGAQFDMAIGETSPSQLFDKFLSLNRRKMIDRQIRQIRDHAGSGTASDDASRQAALVVLGFDSLLGSMGESFAHSVRANPGKPMSEIAWSEKLPVTGVPYVDRVAVKPIEIGGQQVAVEMGAALGGDQGDSRGGQPGQRRREVDLGVASDDELGDLADLLEALRVGRAGRDHERSLLGVGEEGRGEVEVERAGDERDARRRSLSAREASGAGGVGDLGSSRCCERA